MSEGAWQQRSLRALGMIQAAAAETVPRRQNIPGPSGDPRPAKRTRPRVSGAVSRSLRTGRRSRAPPLTGDLRRRECGIYTRSVADDDSEALLRKNESF